MKTSKRPIPTRKNRAQKRRVRSATRELVGTSVIRKEGRAKVTGKALYVEDLKLGETFSAVLHGVTVRSSVARGKIKKIHFDPSIPWNEFCVVSAKDIPADGANVVALITDDQPYLVDQMINHPEEPILLLAHPDPFMAEKARQHIRFDVEQLPGVFTLEESLSQKQVVWGKDNVFKSYELLKGDVDAQWDKAYKVVEGTYETGAQEQLYIENNGVIAVFNSETGVTVWGSLQCPYYVHKALKKLFGFNDVKVRVIQTETGGGFGGKEEYPSMIAGHAALLARKSGRPVRMIYDRAEDMVATTKRHPSRTHHRTAVDRDGIIRAMDIDFVIDGGAYNTLSPVVLSRGTIHAAGPYRCEHVRVRSRAVATNTPPHGAFRGFGAPQSIFALERHLDIVAREVGLTPEELRRRNFLQTGDATATGQKIREKLDMGGILDRALRETNYKAKQKKFMQQNKKSLVKKGIGFAAFMHGAGFTGSGEKYLASKVGLEVLPEGKVAVLASSTEIGQGTNTIFSQVTADCLGIDYDDVVVVQPDTHRVPDSGPTVASRTAMVVGKLVETASLNLKTILRDAGFLKEAYDSKEFFQAATKYIKSFGPLKTIAQYQQPAGVQWDDVHYKGDAYATYAWAVYVAEVSVDTRTFETRVDHFTALQEIGRVIHPTMAAGQIEGGIAQGIGFSLYEKVVWKEGRMVNGQMTNYIMPTAADIPEMKIIFLENKNQHGPGGGAKGIGELPMDGPGPAILNAIDQATGWSFHKIPLLPEDMMGAVTENRMHG